MHTNQKIFLYLSLLSVCFLYLPSLLASEKWEERQYTLEAEIAFMEYHLARETRPNVIMALQKELAPKKMELQQQIEAWLQLAGLSIEDPPTEER